MVYGRRERSNINTPCPHAFHARVGSWLVFTRPLRPSHVIFLYRLQHLSRAKESLCQLGYHREAVKVMMKHAAVERVFAQDSDNTDERHERLLEVRVELIDTAEVHTVEPRYLELKIAHSKWLKKKTRANPREVLLGYMPIYAHIKLIYGWLMLTHLWVIICYGSLWPIYIYGSLNPWNPHMGWVCSVNSNRWYFGNISIVLFTFQALEILKEAVNIADATLHQAQSLSSLSEVR